ncbi:MAG TPA: tail fiber domain-containing protein [Thermoanaerobaculia bacterium]
MKSARYLSIRFIVLALIVAMPFTAFAKDVAKVTGNSSSIDFAPSADHDSLILSVGYPDGRVYTKTFKSGNNPSFRLNDLAKDAPAGSYTYELRLVPRISGSVKASLAAARKNNDDAAIQQIYRENGLGEQVLQVGAFGYANNAFLSLDAPEPAGSGGMISEDGGSGAAKFGPARANDQVIPDDLIVQGSLCVGFDCVDGESFGVDTIRMKENTTRIHYDDTSTSAGYPNNDWRLVANDQGSGGANYWAVEDATAGRQPFKVEAAAPASALYVDSTGNIGISQSNPLLDLHITQPDTPAVRLEQTNAGGFTAQTWDIGANEANFFVRDLTGGSRLPFRIRPGAPTSSVDISASGKVGIGTASPTQMLDVYRNDTAVTTIVSRADNASGISILRAQSGNGTSSIRYAYLDVVSNETGGANWRTGLHGTADYRVSDLTTGTEAVRLEINSGNGYIGLGGVTTATAPIHHSNGATLSTAGVWTNASSRALKQNIETLNSADAMSTLEALKPVTYQYKADPTDMQVGFIAEDVPALVATPNRKGLAPMDVVAVLTKVVQDQQKTIEALNSRLADLEKKNNQ